ncbi:MAG TPA: hypothetical protein VMV27_14275 [Candidatus Binataceae bacterium]|nr:hypothetical protein [Candidatus Binataceae bacterium]
MTRDYFEHPRNGLIRKEPAPLVYQRGAIGRVKQGQQQRGLRRAEEFKRTGGQLMLPGRPITGGCLQAQAQALMLLFVGVAHPRAREELLATV